MQNRLSKLFKSIVVLDFDVL